MKSILIVLLISLFSFNEPAQTFHSFKIKALDSDEVINLSSFKGKKVLVVNVASKCGYTPQYKDLQKLYSQYKDKLVVIGFPCDQFMGQELNVESDIKEFCTEEFNVTFPMTTVIEVKGRNQHPIYSWLTEKSQNGKGDFSISWNFNKFMIDENGNLLEYFESDVKPMDDEILKYLE
ncbi:MAG: glutathione peroxidase [Bacteroidetes bacterium]|nr:glutathione peroxidase [Bacteroidota bacterium]MDA1121278.1 glutathione peroxidase [Bacteroidota bacterium]